MKYLFIFLVTLMVVSFTSCNNDASNSDNFGEEMECGDYSALTEVQRNAELMKLKGKITEFNASEFNVNSKQLTRGLGGFFKRLLKVVATVAADAVGGALGGVPGGITASGIVGGALAFNVTNVAIVPMQAAPSTGIPVNMDSLFYENDVVFGHIVPNINLTRNDSIGFYHNKVLRNMFSNETDLRAFVSMDKNTQAHVIVERMSCEPYLKKYYGKELNDEKKIKIGIETSDKIQAILEESETEDEFFAKLVEIGLTDPGVVSVMKEFIQGFSNIDPTTDDGEYYQKMLSIIDESKLDADTKQRLKDGVVIGQASNHLWKMLDATVEFDPVKPYQGN